MSAIDIKVFFKNCISTNEYTLKITKVEKIISESNENKYKINYSINTSQERVLEYDAKTFEAWFVKKLCLSYIPKTLFVSCDGVESNFEVNNTLKKLKEDSPDSTFQNKVPYHYYVTVSNFVKNLINNSE
jgi:hypothetical protein